VEPDSWNTSRQPIRVGNGSRRGWRTSTTIWGVRGQGDPESITVSVTLGALSECIVKRTDLIDGSVVAAILLQLAGYAALSALVPHSDFAASVEPLHNLPPSLLIPIAILAIPAVVVAIALGVLVSVVGLQPTTVLVLISIYLVSVTSLWVYRRGRRGQLSPKAL
jgi:hypothetical protein